MTLSSRSKAIRWLAAAAENPRVCERDWQRGRLDVHLLTAGRFWHVVVVPACLGLRAADMLHEMPEVGSGPVLLDSRRGETGFFLPPVPDTTSVGYGARHVTRGGWITVPPPHCRWGNLRWLVPPDEKGTLTTPKAMKLAMYRAASEHVCPHSTAAGPVLSSPI
ncbi:hypothetical protein [Streptomyces sp. L2]|uniref:hypothetical protein n=1 Tax=Streptomyces sp. L2 TaxID=2162665 RepID=UPI001F5152F8|nr:hypothetical protein [Streptomyces sp. L2]